MESTATTTDTAAFPDTTPIEAPVYKATGTPTVDGGATFLQEKGSGEKKTDDLISSTDNQSAVKCKKGGKVTLSDLAMATTGNTLLLPETNFYGLNSAVLIEKLGEAKLNRVTMTTKGIGATGVFAMGKGASASLSDTSIITEGDSSRGLMATYDASIFATTTTVKTSGDNAVGIATGHGGGTISMTGGSVESGGINAPAIYSTGVISLVGTDATAVNSEVAVIDGKSRMLVTGGNLSSQATNAVKLFDSGSSGVPKGTAEFKMIGGTLSSTAGAMFYVTNTTANIEIEAVGLKNSASTLLSCTAGDVSGGISNKGGGNATFTAIAQTLSGSIYCDNVSTVDVRLQAGTAYSGSINAENTGKAVRVAIDATSTWALTGTSYVTSFSNGISNYSNIKDGGYDILYDGNDKANKSLLGKTFALPEGGRLMPFAAPGATDTSFDQPILAPPDVGGTTVATSEKATTPPPTTVTTPVTPPTAITPAPNV